MSQTKNNLEKDEGNKATEYNLIYRRKI